MAAAGVTRIQVGSSIHRFIRERNRLITLYSTACCTTVCTLYYVLCTMHYVLCPSHLHISLGASIVPTRTRLYDVYDVYDGRVGQRQRHEYGHEY